MKPPWEVLPNAREIPLVIAEMVLALFSGLCIERNLKSGKASSTGKVGSLMKILRSQALDSGWEIAIHPDDRPPILENSGKL